jgi:chorismate synthase
MNLSLFFCGFGNSCFEKIKAALAAAFMSIKIF